MTVQPTIVSSTRTSRWRRWTDGQSLRASFGSGLLGGLCCTAGAIATAAGLGAAGFFGTLMDRYQIHFIVGSVAIMGVWLLRRLRRQGISVLDIRGVGRTVGRHAVVMGVVYGVTLGIAMAAAQLFAM